MKKWLLIIFASVLLFNGCTTDFNVVAPYKEIMVIDGLINALDTVQYIKVSKAFLGEGNALVMAQQKDSTTYADILDVKLERILSGSIVETIHLTRIDSIQKENGTFNKAQTIYRTPPNTIIKQDGSEYLLTVTNRQTGNVATSNTKIVKDVDSYAGINSPMDLASANQYLAPKTITFTPRSDANAEIYGLTIRFHFREIDPAGNSIQKSIDWTFNEGNIPGEQKYYFYKYDFYNYLASKIPHKQGYSDSINFLPPGVKPIEIMLLEGSQDLHTYMELQKPSNGIVEERPLFTTIQNGLGLFTSRIIHSIYCDPSALTTDSIYGRLNH